MDIRDTGKKVQKFETSLEEVMEKMMQSAAKMDEAEKEFKDKDDDVNAQSRRVLLLEEECRISVEKLATTVYKLANMSKDADQIIKGCRHWESNTMNNEVKIEDLDSSTVQMMLQYIYSGHFQNNIGVEDLLQASQKSNTLFKKTSLTIIFKYYYS